MNQIVDTRAATAVHKSLYAALAAAQAEMGPALKDSTNPAFKTRYADLASVMAACLPALNAHGIAVIQPPFDDDSGNRFVKTILVHGETGEATECRVPLIIGKNDMQGYGSAVTYARRYGLMAMAGIAPDDDDGNAAAAAAPKQSQRQPQEDQRAAFDRAVDDAVKAIGREGSAASLGEFWVNLNATAKPVAADARVIKAKDDRKAALTRPSADIGDDQIPY